MTGKNFLVDGKQFVKLGPELSDVCSTMHCFRPTTFPVFLSRFK